MGEVKESVHGAGPYKSPSPPPASGNLKDQLKSLADEVSRLTAIKDDDALSEGANEKAENIRKAGTLRAANSLLRAALSLLEGY